MEIIALIFFFGVLLSFLSGYPVSLCLGGISVIFGLFHFGPDYFYLLPLRIQGISSNFILVAVPLFVFMGIVLEKSGLASEMLRSMSGLLGGARSGMAIAVIFVGALLAASTGIVGATVVTMGVISLPAMLKAGYHPAVASGTIVSSGTLGQIIPPSIVLVLLGSVLNVSVGDLFTSAIFPGTLLVVGYIVFVILYSKLRPSHFPPRRDPGTEKKKKSLARLARSLVPPLLLIALVLGSIIAGIASPTEAAGIGAFGAATMLLLIPAKRISWKEKYSKIRGSMSQTVKVTSMVFLILVGAQAFAIVFRGLGGEKLLIGLAQNSALEANEFVILILAIVFIAGFFIDFIEIIFIIIPVVLPILNLLEVDLVWFGILIAINLQASFLTPPFGFSLFYLKGVAPAEVKTVDIYRGIIPYICIQLVVIGLVYLLPVLTMS